MFPQQQIAGLGSPLPLSPLSALGKLFVLTRDVEQGLGGEVVGDQLGKSARLLSTFAPVVRCEL